jgi:hypothetical protein
VTDRRQVLRVLLLGAAGAAVPPALAACGVPGGGHAVVDGAGPSVGAGGSTSGGDPPDPRLAGDPVELVRRYLLAAAGPLEDNYRNTLQESARRFMTAAQRATWSPGQGITVVRVIGDPIPQTGRASTTVDIKLQRIGSLDTYGAVSTITNPAGLPPVVSCQFEVVDNPDRSGGWLINDISSPDDRSLASAMLLSSDALDTTSGLFTPQVVYYWPTGDPDGLVPDLRYIPVKGSDQQRLTRIVADLLGGPADWLDAKPLPTDMKLASPLVALSDGLLTVNLSTAGPDPNRLMTQLRWSLWALFRERVQLQVSAQPQQVDGASSDFKRANVAAAPSRGSGTADEFCVAGEVVRPLRADTPVPPVLNSAQNIHVVWAALSRDKDLVAVVRDAGGGRYGLWLGAAGSPAYLQVNVPPRTTNFSRPAWLPGQPRVLVLVDNRLYAADMSGRAASDVTPNGVNQVKAFSVAPDGQRIALIADGVPAVATLSSTSQPILVNAPQRFTAAHFEQGSLSAIAWTRLERVVIAGHTSGGYGLVEMTIDGAVDQRLTDVNLRDAITHLVGYPPSPSGPNSNARGKILGQAQLAKKAYSFEYARAYNPLAQLQVAPSPAPSSSPGHTQALTATAPFFAD